MSSKAESIAECSMQLSVLGLVKSQVETRVYFRVIGKMVDGRRYKIVLHG